MKTIAKMMSMTFLLVGMFSCIKTDRLYDDGQTEIAMRPVMSSMSKAPVNGTTYPEDVSFGVIAHYLSGENAPVPYIYNQEFVNQGDDTFGGSTPCYWPHQGSLIFAGYSPYKIIGTPSFNPETKTLLIEDFESDGQTDLMYFLPDVSSEGNFVGVVNTEKPVAAFSHALTLLEFNIYGLEGDETIKITKVTVSDWRAQGNFSVTVGNAPEWTETGSSATEEIYTNDNGAEISHETPVEIQALVIPGATTDITITYDIHAAETHTGKTATITTADIAEFDTWATGKKYIYNITISSKFINIVPLVEDFGFGSNYSENIK